MMLPCTSILVAMQYLLIFFKSMNIPAGKYTEFACDAEDKLKSYALRHLGENIVYMSIQDI
jgi:hypothetical protein